MKVNFRSDLPPKSCLESALINVLLAENDLIRFLILFCEKTSEHFSFLCDH